MHGHFWSPSCFAASCGGAPLSIIEQYIEQQRRRPDGRAGASPRPEGQGLSPALGHLNNPTASARMCSKISEVSV